MPTWSRRKGSSNEKLFIGVITANKRKDTNFLATFANLKCLKGKSPKTCGDEDLRARAAKLQEEFINNLLQKTVTIKQEAVPPKEIAKTTPRLRKNTDRKGGRQYTEKKVATPRTRRESDFMKFKRAVSASVVLPKGIDSADKFAAINKRVCAVTLI